MGKLKPESLLHNKSLQDNLDRLRKNEGYDFGAIAMYEHYHRSSPIKWKYVSGNTNERYKLIILRKGRGLAGTKSYEKQGNVYRYGINSSRENKVSHHLE